MCESPMMSGVGAHPPHPVHLLQPLDSVHTQVGIGLASGMLRILTALLGLGESFRKGGWNQSRSQGDIVSLLLFSRAMSEPEDQHRET